MAEDQSANGDRWTLQGSELLKRLGWNKVADHNIDIEGSDGKAHGIDSLFSYKDYARNLSEGVFLEAKSYLSGSFNSDFIGEWVKTLDDKMHEISMGGSLYETYPVLTHSKMRNGLLMLWFRDKDKYIQVAEKKVAKGLEETDIPRKRHSGINRLFVLTNPDILRLSSLVNTVDKFNQEAKDSKIKYLYLSNFEQPAREEDSLSLEYMYSKFIPARSADQSVIFYFGSLEMQGFSMLKSALFNMQFIESNKRLVIYLYKRDDNFRKIKPEVEALFRGDGYPEFEIRSMELLADLPSWMPEIS